jgi:undecaprenyl-diphosphatase
MSQLSYFEAFVVGAFQGVTELFPVSSLGHSVLLPALIGGRWARDLNVSTPESPYLAFIVGLHVATAAALLLFFWRDWVRIIRGFVTSIVHRRIDARHERLAWLIVIATIPVGISGLLLEHLFRTTLGRPVPAAAFLLANGAVLAVGEWLRKRSDARAGHGSLASDNTSPVRALTMADVVAPAGGRSSTIAGPDGTNAIGPVETSLSAGPSAGTGTATGLLADHRLATMSVGRAVWIGSAQILALLPGISRSGATIVAGLTRGLSHEDAARFSFLLATPVILAAGILKVPDLFGPLGNGIHGQILVGSLASFASAYLAVRFLVRWFHTRTLTPFAIYCVVVGGGSLLWLTTH